jgi:hypothetical protein
MTRFGLLGTLVATSNRARCPITATVVKVIHSSETSVLTTATRRSMPAAGILHSHCRDNLKFYMEQNYFSVHFGLLPFIT